MLILGNLTDVLIGLALVFMMVSLFASTVTEAMASFLGWRAKTFMNGLRELLNDPELNGLAQAVLNHAAVNPRGSGTDLSKSIDRGEIPSYVAPRQFANALLDVIQNPPSARPPVHLSIDSAIAAIPDTQLKMFFEGIYDRASGDIKQIHSEITDWFETAMDRVSGVYKRHVQLVSFCVAFVASLLFNIDALHIAAMVWEHPEIIASMQPYIEPAKPAEPCKYESGSRYMAMDKYPEYTLKCNKENHDLQLIEQSEKEGLIGWPLIDKHNEDDAGKVLQRAVLKCLGWFITAIAAIFGAPFWFDLLQRFVRLRGTGKPPAILKRE